MSTRIRSFGSWWPSVDDGSPNGDRATDYGTGDNNQNDVTSIKPVENGEPANADTFQRPETNLWQRTERLRQWVEEIDYVLDSDRAFTLTGGGTIEWSGAGDPAGFTTTADLVLRPFATTGSSVPAKRTTPQIIFVADENVTGPGRPERDYSGANKLAVEIVDGGAESVVISGADSNIITVNFELGVTTVQNLLDLVNDDAGLTAKGIRAEINAETGTNAGDLVTAEDMGRFSGAVDAEVHLITSAALNTFFIALDGAGEAMQIGDVLAVSYQKVNEWFDNGGIGGRRQSLDEPPESNADVENNLFLVRLNPDRVPGCLPVCRVNDAGDLEFVSGAVFRPSIPGTLRRVVGYNVAGYGTGQGVGGEFVGGDTAPDMPNIPYQSAGILATGGSNGGPGIYGVGTDQSPGGRFYGGSNGGRGVEGVGLGTAYGVYGAGGLLGTGTGVYGIGGQSGTSIGVAGVGHGAGAGVQGTGGETGYGVKGIGGATSGAGVYGEGAAGNADGVSGKANGTGAGVKGVGAHNSGYGVYGDGGAGTSATGVYGKGGQTGNSIGVSGLANGTGSGVKGVAAHNSGYGVYGDGGAGTTATGVYGIGGQDGKSIGVKGVGYDGGAGVRGETTGVDPEDGALIGVNSGNGPGIYGESSGYVGVLGVGTGTQSGVLGVGAGGDTAGIAGGYGVAGYGAAGNSGGVYGEGTGNDAGVTGKGGGSGGAGIIGIPGSSGAPGVSCNGKLHIEILGSAPGTLNDGDLWVEDMGGGVYDVKIRLGGVTKTVTLS